MVNRPIQDRASEYAESRGLVIREQLGFGVHGSVFAASLHVGQAGRYAIKVHEHEACYERERDVYKRLLEFGVETVNGCNVPELIDYQNRLWVIEMTIVARPYALDFAGAYLDRRPDYPREI